jgi:hypothetical protein
MDLYTCIFINMFSVGSAILDQTVNGVSTEWVWNWLEKYSGSFSHFRLYISVLFYKAHVLLWHKK